MMPTSTADQIREVKAWRIVQKLRNYHQLGRMSLNVPESKISHWMTQWGLSGESVRKFRQFAKGYSDAQFDELCKLRRKSGLPFHWGYVGCFLSLAGGRERTKLQKSAAAANWTVAEVQAEVKRINNHRKVPIKSSRGGRPLKRLIDRPRTLKRMVRELKALDRRLQQAIESWEGLRHGTAGNRQIAEMVAAFAEVAGSINAKFGRLEVRR